MNIRDRNIPWYLVSVFIALALSFITIGIIFYVIQKKHIKDEKYNELAAISNLKVGQIQSWVTERMNDAETIMNDRQFGAQFLRWRAGQNEPYFPQYLNDITRVMVNSHEYSDIILADTSGTKLVSLYKSVEILSPETREMISNTVKKKDVLFSDFYWCSLCKKIHLDVIAPLVGYPAANPIIQGVIILRVDPFNFIYKLVQTWPTASQTAETLLIRKEGNEVLYLNELRHRKNTALKLRFPFSEKSNLPAALAVQGKEGIVEGIDYRNVEVLADIKKIPGTSWFMVAKVDMSEINAPIQSLLLIISIIVFAFTGLAGLGSAWWWSHQRMIFFREKHDAEVKFLELETQFGYLTRYANDIILLATEDMKIVMANDRAVETYGFTREELLNLSIQDLCVPEEAADMEKQLQLAEALRGSTYETRHRRKDGTVFPVEISARSIDAGGQKKHLEIIREITERKQAELRVLSLNRIYLVMSKISKAVAHIRDIKELLYASCKIMVEHGGFSMAWVGMVNEQTSMVEPAAWHGANAEEYLKDIRISVDDIPEGGGPSGRAIREGKPFICQDISTAEYMGPWRKRASRIGYKSTAAFPITVNHAAVGMISLYSSEPLFFSDEEAGFIDEIASEIGFGIEFIDNETERKLAGEKLFDLNKALEERVAIRTAQLDAAVKELEAFSYSVSHDLKAPLRAIEGFSKIVIDDYSGTLDHDTTRLLNLVQDNARRMAQLIDDLLSFSRVGRHELSIQKIDMTAQVNSVWQELVSLEPNRRFEFTVGNLAETNGDLSLMRQVWTNLISNAIKFTSTREVGTITVGCTVGDDETIYFIKDNGAGYDMQYADKLFGVFQRLHSSNEFPGSGVGLALIRRIIDRHGGRVWAEGRVDGGAAFYFSLKSPWNVANAIK